MEHLKEIKEKVAPIARKYNVSQVYLFGSYARGNMQEESDLDLAIHDEGSDIKDLLSLIRMENDLENVFGLKVDLLTLYQIHENNVPLGRRFCENFEREKVLLYEK